MKLKIKKFLDQRQNVLWEEHERDYAAQKLAEMFDREIQKNKPKQSLLTKEIHYKRILKTAGVPKIIIEHPSFIERLPMSKDDIDIAKKRIEEHQEYLKFKKRNSK